MTAPGPRARRRHHDWIDERSRALHIRVAEKLLQNPALIGKALENLNRWEGQSGADQAMNEWRQLLTRRSVEEVAALLCEDSENADRLRQSTPFAGVLTEAERMAILREYAAL